MIGALTTFFIAMLASDQYFRRMDRFNEMASRLEIEDRVYPGRPWTGGVPVLVFEDGSEIRRLVTPRDFEVVGGSMSAILLQGQMDSRRQPYNAKKMSPSYLADVSNSRATFALVDPQEVPLAYASISLLGKNIDASTFFSASGIFPVKPPKPPPGAMGRWRPLHRAEDKITVFWIDLFDRVKQGRRIKHVDHDFDIPDFVRHRSGFQTPTRALKEFSKDEIRYHQGSASSTHESVADLLFRIAHLEHLERTGRLDDEDENDLISLEGRWQSLSRELKSQAPSRLIENLNALGIWGTGRGRKSTPPRNEPIELLAEAFIEIPGSVEHLLGVKTLISLEAKKLPYAKFLEILDRTTPDYAIYQKFVEPILVWRLSHEDGTLISEQSVDLPLIDFIRESFVDFDDYYQSFQQRRKEEAEEISRSLPRRWVLPKDTAILPRRSFLREI